MMKTSRLVCLVSLICLAWMNAGGCEASPQAAAELHLAVNSYENHDYATAQEQAESALAGAHGEARYEAAYVAGISAFQLNNLRTAETHFELARLSSNSETSGKAAAMLGIIRMSHDQPSQAASDFETASAQLTGYDATRAADLANRASQQASGIAVYSSSASPGTTGRSVGRTGRSFSLQAGAFLDRSKADRAAQSASTFANSIRAGEVRVVPTVEGRDRMYLVQFGHYSTRQSAAGARGQRLEYIVVPTAY